MSESVFFINMNNKEETQIVAKTLELAKKVIERKFSMYNPKSFTYDDKYNGCVDVMFTNHDNIETTLAYIVKVEFIEMESDI